MDRSKNVRYGSLGWSKEQREFCVEQFYLNRGVVAAVRRFYCEKFCLRNVHMQERCPSSDKIRQWVRMHENKRGPQEEQRTEPSKLSGTQWGRKTGENRIIRTESIDIGLQHQAIKWKQRDIKWSGPRPLNEKEKIVEPIVEVPHYNYYYYQEPVEEEVKPDKKQVLQEKYEEKVLELVELLNARGHAARASAFVSLHAELQRRALDGLLTAHRAILADHVSRALRRGKDGERKAAAAIAPLLAVQIGEEGSEEFVREVRPALAATATDKSASLDARTESCSSLAVLCYLMEDDLSEILEVMRMYETIFSGSYLKDDGSVKVSGEAVEEGAWHAAALDGWALLLPLLSPSHALSLLNNQAPSFAKLGELLYMFQSCSSLAVLCYLMEDDLSEILEVMRMYETIFSGSYLKDDGSVKVSGEAVEEGAWHAAALDGWALLLPLLSPSHALSLLNNQAPSFAKLGELLEAVSLEVRMAAGGALAIAYETVTDDDNTDNALTAHVDVLLPRLTELARDSHKFRAKRDRKIQRATFRDILKYFEEGEQPCISAHIGAESASGCGWARGAAYAALAPALGGSLHVLAPRCPRLRAALELADVSPKEMAPKEKPNKLQRHLQNRAASKARNFTRNKNRDKRSAVLAN